MHFVVRRIWKKFFDNFSTLHLFHQCRSESSSLQQVVCSVAVICSELTVIKCCPYAYGTMVHCTVEVTVDREVSSRMSDVLKKSGRKHMEYFGSREESEMDALLY